MKKIFLFLAVFLAISCDKNYIFTKKDIEREIKSNQDNFKIPKDFYIKTTSDSIVKLSLTSILNLINTSNGNENNKKDDIYNLLNFTTKVEEDTINKYYPSSIKFSLDTKISNFYQNNSFDLFIKKYTKQRNNKFFLNCNSTIFNTCETIIFSFYLQKYKVYKDDYIGIIYFVK